ncbi:MAG: molybdate ABC transporter substrate-binding protein [Andreesenia angusta]|nr:molybdate ABC transporter substrate-binding protein [Andreesenia angusta]
MKRFKKAVIVGGVLLALTSVYGCGANNDKNDSANTENKVETSTDKEKEESQKDEKDEEEKEEKKLDPEITVSAAASLRESFTEIAENFEKEYGTKVNLNFGSSGALQKQIEEGAPSDYFVSAGQKQMKALEEASLVDSDSVKDFLGNKLVLAVPKDSDEIKTVEDLEGTDGKIAIAEIDSVPVGQYTKEALDNLNIWDKIEDKIVFAKDVKATTAYIEQGEAVAGFIYKSDAIAAPGVDIAEEIDESTHKPITYPEGIVTASEKKETVKEFSEFLKTDESKAILEKYGFEVK